MIPDVELNGRISGVGIDIVSLDRIKSLWEKHRQRFSDDLFTSREMLPLLTGGSKGTDWPEQLTLAQLQYLGSRFAAKEAALKALGAPYQLPHNWSDIEIIGSEQLEIDLFNDPKEYAMQAGIKRLFGSASSTDKTSVAIIVRES